MSDRVFDLSFTGKRLIFEVFGKPPYKQTPADETERANQLRYKNTLQERARTEFQDKEIFTGKCEVSILYERKEGKADSANIIGGIMDCLEGIAFKNDKQVAKIQYKELVGISDRYEVAISEL